MQTDAASRNKNRLDEEQNDPCCEDLLRANALNADGSGGVPGKRAKEVGSSEAGENSHGNRCARRWEEHSAFCFSLCRFGRCEVSAFGPKHLLNYVERAAIRVCDFLA